MSVRMNYRLRWLAAALMLASQPALALPSFAEVRAAHRASDAWLLARDGTPLATLRLDYGVRRLPWTPLHEIAPTLKRAVLISEDKRFNEHAGVLTGKPRPPAPGASCGTATRAAPAR